MKFTALALTACIAAFSATTSSAAVVGAQADGELLGFTPAFMDNGSITDNFSIKAFDEVQDFVLTSDVTTDQGVITSGTAVSSHMVFLNRVEGTNGAIALEATFEFTGEILGVLSSTNLQNLSDSILGGATDYAGLQRLRGRGLEGNDTYEVFGNFFTTNLRVTEPGDWVRVVTVAAVPLPAGAILLPGALLALGGLRRRKAKAAA